MPHLPKGHVAVDQFAGPWVRGVEGEEIAGGLASSPLAGDHADDEVVA